MYGFGVFAQSQPMVSQVPPKVELCWVHSDHCTAGAENCTSIHHSCVEPGRGRLGLCEKHELELLGEEEE